MKRSTFFINLDKRIFGYFLIMIPIISTTLNVILQTSTSDTKIRIFAFSLMLFDSYALNVEPLIALLTTYH